MAAIDTANFALNIIIFIFGLILLIRISKSASRFASGDAGTLFRRLRTSFIIFFLFTFILGAGNLLAFLDIHPAVMSTAETFGMLILIAHVLLIISLIVFLGFAKKFAEFSERFSFGK